MNNSTERLTRIRKFDRYADQKLAAPLNDLAANRELATVIDRIKRQAEQKEPNGAA